METKRFNIEIKANLDESDDKVGVIDGYASIFGNIDYGLDMVHGGAFTKTIRESKNRAMYFMHKYDIDNLIGGATKFKQDDTGLKFKGEIDLEDGNGLKAWKNAKRKIISEVSIGYHVVKADFEEVKGKQIRNLRELKLSEVSLITSGMAMNKDAIIHSVKNIDEIVAYISANKNDVEVVKKVISLFDREPEELITLIKSIYSYTQNEEPNDSITDEEHYDNLVNILNGGKQ